MSALIGRTAILAIVTQASSINGMLVLPNDLAAMAVDARKALSQTWSEAELRMLSAAQAAHDRRVK